MLKKVLFPVKKVEGSNVRITESLTQKCMETLKKARFTNVWTSDGKILYKDSTENKIKLYYE